MPFYSPVLIPYPKDRGYHISLSSVFGEGEQDASALFVRSSRLSESFVKFLRSPELIE